MMMVAVVLPKVLVVGLLGLFASCLALQRLSRNCIACSELSKEVEYRLNETAKRANEEMKIGGRIGPQGEPTPKRIVRYENSEARFYDIMENICAKNKYKNACYEIVDDYEHEIYNWFFTLRSTSFLETICFSTLSGCSVNFLEAAEAEAKLEAAAKESEAKDKENGKEDDQKNDVNDASENARSKNIGETARDSTVANASYDGNGFGEMVSQAKVNTPNKGSTDKKDLTTVFNETKETIENLLSLIVERVRVFVDSLSLGVGIELSLWNLDRIVIVSLALLVLGSFALIRRSRPKEGRAHQGRKNKSFKL